MATAATAGPVAFNGVAPAPPLTREALRLDERGIPRNRVFADLNRILAHSAGDTRFQRISDAGQTLEVSAATITNLMAGKSPIGPKLLEAMYGPGIGSEIAADFLDEPADCGGFPLDDWMMWEAVTGFEQQDSVGALAEAPLAKVLTDGEVDGSHSSLPPQIIAAVVPEPPAVAAREAAVSAALPPPILSPVPPAADLADSRCGQVIWNPEANVQGDDRLLPINEELPLSLRFAVTAIEDAIDQVQAEADGKIAKLQAARLILEELVA